MPYDLAALTRLTQVALTLQAAVSALAVAFAERLTAPAEDDAVAVPIALGQTLAFLFAAVCFLIWTYRAKADGNATGAAGVSFSPAFATWSYFIPLVNLVVPVQAMQELHKTASGARDWEAQSGSGLIWLWWFFWIAANIAGIVVFRLTTMDGAPDLGDGAATLGVVSDLGTLLASLALIRIVGTISARLMHLRDTMQFA